MEGLRSLEDIRNTLLEIQDIGAQAKVPRDVTEWIRIVKDDLDELFSAIADGKWVSLTIKSHWIRTFWPTDSILAAYHQAEAGVTEKRAFSTMSKLILREAYGHKRVAGKSNSL